MKRHMVFVVTVIFVPLLLMGCRQDPVQKDLLDYLNNKLAPLAETETQIANSYDSVIGENYTTDEETHRVLTEDVMPKYRDFALKLEEIQPQTQEVQEIHELYITAVNKQYNAIVQMIAALEHQDTSLVVEANERLSEGRSGIRNYHNKLHALAVKHNVEMQN